MTGGNEYPRSLQGPVDRRDERQREEAQAMVDSTEEAMNEMEAMLAVLDDGAN